MNKLLTLITLLKIKFNKLFKHYYQIKNDIIFIKPCYYIFNKFEAKSIIVDIGTGNDADFSQSMISKYGLKSFGFDPTKKHQAPLKKIEEKLADKFKLNNYALSDKNGTITFYESQDNISGSLNQSHVNIKRDKVQEYTVETVTIDKIFEILNVSYIDLIKIDVEGEEYKIVDSLSQSTLDKIGQIILEFHHHCIDSYTYQDTKDRIEKMKQFGFKVFTIDNINYLFFK